MKFKRFLLLLALAVLASCLAVGYSWHRGFARPAAGVAGAEVTLRSVQVTATANTSFRLPPGAQIIAANVAETAGHTVSLNLGTSSGGSDVISAFSATASTQLVIPLASVLKQLFAGEVSPTNYGQILFLNSSSWSSASVVLTLVYVCF